MKMHLSTLMIILFCVSAHSSPNNMGGRIDAFTATLADVIYQKVSWIPSWDRNMGNHLSPGGAQDKATRQIVNNRKGAEWILNNPDERLAIFNQTFQRTLGNPDWHLDANDYAFQFFNAIFNSAFTQNGNFSEENYIGPILKGFAPRDARSVAWSIAVRVRDRIGNQSNWQNKHFLNHLYWSCEGFITQI